MSLRFALSLAILIFFGTLLARLPARAIVALLPAGSACDQPQGTIWHGSCARVQSGTLSLTDFGWTVHPSELLRLKLSADLTSSDPRIMGQAQLQLERGGTIVVHALQAHLPLQQGLSIFPSGFQGTLDVDVATLQLQHGELAALVGTLRAQQLGSDSFGELGDFELSFSPADAAAPNADSANEHAAAATGASRDGSVAVGQLHDLSGPLSLQAQLLLKQRNGYQVSGSMMARTSASRELTQALALLGPPDSAGRRSFSLAGTL
jgi:hypothetical protein